MSGALAPSGWESRTPPSGRFSSVAAPLPDHVRSAGRHSVVAGNACGSGAATLEKRPDGGVRLSQPDGAKA
ncbi:MAG: hypothetical protein ACKONH_12730, partial [Planctomycetia bacterium]